MNEKETVLGLIGGVENEIQEELNQAYMEHGRITAQDNEDISYTEKYQVRDRCNILKAQVDVLNKISTIIQEAIPNKPRGAMV